MHAGQSIATLHRYFTGLAEQIFQVQLGVADPPLIDYLSELLVRFLHIDQIHRFRTPGGEVGHEIGHLLREAERRVGGARRACYRHVGDFTLFWAGLFPEHLQRTQLTAEVDRYDEFCLQGKRSYLIASSLETDVADAASGEVLERLGTEFELCAYGLREVRRGWEEGDPPPPLQP